MEEVFSRKLTVEDIQKLNELKPKYISVRSASLLDYRLLAELDKSIEIRIIDEDAEKNLSKEKGNQASKALEELPETYSVAEMQEILMRYEEFENGIHQDWSDLDKSLYLYARMITEYDLATENQTNENSKSLKSFITFNPDSRGFAQNYKELMDRIGIPCRIVENEDGTYAWNEIMIDGQYYPVDLAKDTRESHAKGPGSILVHNFGKNPEFYEYEEHKVKEKPDPKELKLLDREAVQTSLSKVVDQIGIDQTKRVQKVRENVKIELHSKELSGLFEENTITLETLEEAKPLRISVSDDNIEELSTELKTIATYYPEILNNVEIVNTTDSHIDLQEVVDNVYEARKVGKDITLEPIALTISSSHEEDFDIDFSTVPQAAHDNKTEVDEPISGQKVSFRNTDPSKKIKVPNFGGKVSENITEIGFEGFDVEGLDLTGTKINRLTFNETTNMEKVSADPDVSYAVEFKAVSAADLTAALSNFSIHDLTIDGVDVHDRPILQELARNPDLVNLRITSSHLNRLDGLEDFDGRLYSLNLQVNDLGIDAIERLEAFYKTNPTLEYYLSNNTGINRVIDSLPEISDETFNFIREYQQLSGSRRNVNTKKDAINYLLWSQVDVPYYIKDAAIISDGLHIKVNAMMVENDAELDSFDFTQDYLKDGTLLLTPAQVEHLISINKAVPQNVRLKINSAADLTTDYANDLAQRANAIGINIDQVQVYADTRHNNGNQIAPYKLTEYLYIRDTLDLLVDGIDPSDSDIDKFATIYQRLMDSITYDHDAVNEDTPLQAKYYAEKRDTSRNLLEGLEEGKCVCSGYADILRNALLMVGLNIENISGYTRKDSHGEDAGFHAWNMVELDDGSGKKWYLTDLTWAAGDPANLEKWTLRGTKPEFTTKHMPYSQNLPTVSNTDFDRNLLRAAFARAKGKSFNIKDKQKAIDIPEDPELQLEILDKDKILKEYTRRKNDMFAKYFGDPDYRDEYMERSNRFKSHEIEENDGSHTYRTIEDYPERAEDEEFLLLDKYAECLERMTRYEDGDTSVYQGDADAVAKALAKDKEYVETRNHTFDKNKLVRNNLATLGKYGERVPYIPKQPGLLRNAGRLVLNAGILARNLVSPIYRGIGRYIAQPIHRLIVGDRESSPFRNNWYHRMVARRDYFTEYNNTNNPNHPIINGVKARFDAIFKAKDGNRAVLNAGASEIQTNIVAQEREAIMIRSLTTQSAAFDAQIAALQAAIAANPKSSNIDDARQALKDKLDRKAEIDEKIDLMQHNRIGTSQTDAISDAQHDIAVKEEVTTKTTIIKGVAKGLAVKYVGPKIHEWLSSRGTKTVTEQVTTQVPVEKQRWVDPTYKTEQIPIYEDRLDTGKTMSEMMSANSGKTVTGFYSVYGGENRPAEYLLSGNEKVTAIFQAQGKGGTGLSDIVGLKAPTLVDRTFAQDMLTSNGLLNQNLTIDQLIEAVSNGTVDASAIGDMYVSIGDRYWARLSDLTSGLVSKVQTGTELKKVLDVAGHYESYTDYIDKISNVTHTVVNERAVRFADLTNNIFRVGFHADNAIDVAENLRFTHTNVRDNKLSPKDYEFDGDDEIPTSRREYRNLVERDRDDD